MNKKVNVVLALLVVGFAISCKQSQERTEAAAMESNYDAVEKSEVVSSSAAKVDPKSNRKFVRTADIKFKVKNVTKSTNQIEDATVKFGGFVTYTNLQSHILNEENTKISQDSSLVTTKYYVENDITIRVPNTQLDTVIKTIAKQIHFLNYRVIKADDVTFQMLSNKMAQKRSDSSEKRLANSIDNKGKKLNQIVEAEDTLDQKKEQNDATKLQNLSLEDQINFSTLTLQIYQDEALKQEMVANEKSLDSYRPNIGLQIWESLKSGWFILENILAFLVSLWPFIFIGFIGIFGYKKLIKKQLK
ncbi:DUF4349 domain-containing protein [uncultured Flavobacterium sp.]|uniref:DUF4349 domain-containing protein n=1 Tax=uncultured Flavobacterium sp. TaxID=165435 RepID=UPI0030EE9EC1